MPDATRGTELHLLTAIQQRLEAKVTGLREGNCLVTDQMYPVQLLQDLVCTVSAARGQFSDLLWTGGGHHALAEEIPITVAVFRRCHLDRNDQAAAALLDRDGGLISIYKPRLLRALLAGDDGHPWEPLYNGASFLRDQLQPLDSERGVWEEAGSGRTFLFQSIRLRAFFDWVL